MSTCSGGRSAVGGTGMTLDEYTANFATWAVLASNLVLSVDLRSLPRGPCLDLLSNEEVLAVNQDPAGRAPRVLFQRGPAQGFARPLADGSQAVLLLSRGEGRATLRVTWAELGVAGPCRVRDLLARTDLGALPSFQAALPKHAAALVKVVCAGSVAAQYV